MKTIHKYRLEQSKEPVSLQLREGYRFVRSEYLVTEKAVFIWVEETLSPKAKLLTRQFKIVFSGEPVPEDYVYLDTALDTFGPEAYHVFELPAQETRLDLLDESYIAA